jgi:hypothetical protein
MHVLCFPLFTRGPRVQVMLRGRAVAATHVTIDNIQSSLEQCVLSAHVNAPSGHPSAMPPGMEGEVGQPSMHSLHSLHNRNEARSSKGGNLWEQATNSLREQEFEGRHDRNPATRCGGVYSPPRRDVPPVHPLYAHTRLETILSSGIIRAGHKQPPGKAPGAGTSAWSTPINPLPGETFASAPQKRLAQPIAESARSRQVDACPTLSIEQPVVARSAESSHRRLCSSHPSHARQDAARSPFVACPSRSSSSQIVAGSAYRVEEARRMKEIMANTLTSRGACRGWAGPQARAGASGGPVCEGAEVLHTELSDVEGWSAGPEANQVHRRRPHTIGGLQPEWSRSGRTDDSARTSQDVLKEPQDKGGVLMQKVQKVQKAMARDDSALHDPESGSLRGPGGTMPVDGTSGPLSGSVRNSLRHLGSLVKGAAWRSLRGGTAPAGAAANVYGVEPKHLWQMTAQTGSYAYMPPEVFRGHPYNAKVDVFAAAILIYQLFAQINITSQFQNEVDAYNFAQRMCNGHRPRMPQKFPPKLRELLEAGWHEDPNQRPTASQLLSNLKRFEQSEEYQTIAGGSSGCVCCCFG